MLRFIRVSTIAYSSGISLKGGGTGKEAPSWRMRPRETRAAALRAGTAGVFVSFFLPAIPKLLEVGGDGGIELHGLLLLFPQLCSKPLHLLPERLAVVFLRFGADVAAGCEHVAVLADFLQRRALAEAGDVRVFARFVLSPPRVLRVRGA